MLNICTTELDTFPIGTTLQKYGQMGRRHPAPICLSVHLPVLASFSAERPLLEVLSLS